MEDTLKDLLSDRTRQIIDFEDEWPQSTGELMALAKDLKSCGYAEYFLHDLVLNKFRKMSKQEKNRMRGQISWAWRQR